MSAAGSSLGPAVLGTVFRPLVIVPLVCYAISRPFPRRMTIFRNHAVARLRMGILPAANIRRPEPSRALWPHRIARLPHEAP